MDRLGRPFERRELCWLLLAALVAAWAGWTRVHNALEFFPFWDFDGAGHALHAYAWFEGHAPDPRSWSGFHPPLYYATAGLLWHVLPESLPMHASLRLLSALCGAITLVVVFRVLIPRLGAVDAALVSLLGWCVPFVAIATSMSGNEAMCALFVTALLAHHLTHPPDPGSARLLRGVAVSGVLAGLALLSKSTALIALGAVGLDLLWRLRLRPGRMLACGALLGGVALLVAAPHYARVLMAAGGSPFALLSGSAVSPELEAAMAVQPPGVREIRDYLSFPASALLAPVYIAPGLMRSVPGLLYASIWAEGHAHFLASGVPAVLWAQAALALLGLLPSALLALGALRVLRHPRAHADWAAPLLLGALLPLGLLFYTWRFPTYSAVKASYLLVGLLPYAYLVGQGLLVARGRARTWLRVILVVIACAATQLTTFGWWRP